MITSIRIEGLRGIRSGGLEGLSPLTVLVGANGCGKSTILDGLLIGAGRVPGDAVGRVVARRMELRAGARWLFLRGGRTEDASARIRVELAGSAPRDVTLRLLPVVSAASEEKLLQRRAPAPFTEIQTQVKSGPHALTALTALSYDNTYVIKEDDAPELRQIPYVYLVDPRHGGLHPALSRSYSDVVEEGRHAATVQLVAAVVDGVTSILNLTDEAGGGVVHLVYEDGSVPVALSGDGIQSLVQVCFALARPPGDTVLLEEPEANQHPRVIHQTARALAGAVRRGVQVILSTHSLELIDALRDALDEDLSPLTVHHLALPRGELRAVRYTGSEVALARDAIGEDLR